MLETHSTQNTHRLIPEAGVIVVEVSGPLRKADIDALADTADAYLQDHGVLHGIVVHARHFPGWQDFGTFLRHARFVRDHHRKVARVALVAEGRMVELGPRIAEHFVAAEVQGFRYEQLDAAITWTKGDVN